MPCIWPTHLKVELTNQDSLGEKTLPSCMLIKVGYLCSVEMSLNTYDKGVSYFSLLEILNVFGVINPFS